MAKLKKSAKKLIIIIIIGYDASSVLYERIIFSNYLLCGHQRNVTSTWQKKIQQIWKCKCSEELLELLLEVKNIIFRLVYELYLQNRRLL